VTRRRSPFVAALLSAAILSGTSGSQPLSPDTGGTRIGERQTPADEVEAAARLHELMPAWAGAARRYERYALRFLCSETHRTIDYSRFQGEARKEKEKVYGYLLTLDPSSTDYQVIRQVLDSEGRPTGGEKKIDVPAPEPYSWTQIFLPTLSSTLRFHYLGREIQHYKLTHVVSFEGSAPGEEGRDIREWSGTVWIEENTGNIVRVEARPNYQNERIRTLWKDYVQSFSFPWGKAKARPHGYALAVVFDFERDGLLFPTRVDLTDFTWIATNREVVDTRLVLTYDDYRFFRIESEEKVHGPKPGSP